MTGAVILDNVCNPFSYDVNSDTKSSRALGWINQAQLDMAQKDFPELITRNASFITDGDESYDLTGETYFGSTFLRVVDDSVKIDDRSLDSKPKTFFDLVDPQRNYGTEAWAYGMCGRTDFRLWPAESSGSTCYLDWVAYPTDIASDTAEASISFDKDWHHLIVLGAIRLGYLYHGDTDNYVSMETMFTRKLNQAIINAGRVNYKTTQINAIEF